MNRPEFGGFPMSDSQPEIPEAIMQLVQKLVDDMKEENRKQMQKMEEENKKKIELVQQNMEKKVRYLKGELERRLDPWARVRNGTTTSSHKKKVQEEFQEKLRKTTGNICQLTGQTDGCRAAHIIPLSSDLLDSSEKSDPHNSMFVLATVEKAFDRQQIIFKCNDLNAEAKLAVLDQSIFDDHVYPGKTWRALQGQVLDISKHRPSFRLLNLHAEYALKFCFGNGKIDRDTFDELMVFASFHTSPPRENPIKRWLFEANQTMGLASLQFIFSGVAVMSLYWSR